MDIEIVKRNAPKRIGLNVAGSLTRRLTVTEALSLMVHLGSVIEWAMEQDARASDSQHSPTEGNEKGS